MLKNHLKIAWRTLIRYKQYSLLNLVGLAVGITAFLMIGAYVHDELSYDRFFDGSEQIYRITTYWEDPTGISAYATTPPPLMGIAKDQIPDITAATRVFKWGDFTLRTEANRDNPFRETEVFAVDPDFPEVFDYGWISGDPATAFSEPFSFVLPKSMAVKYFGEQAVAEGRVLGQHLLIGKDGGTIGKVTGILEDLPDQTHFRYDMLVSAATYDQVAQTPNWNWNIMHTYVKLHEGASIATVKTNLKEIVSSVALPAINNDANTSIPNGYTFEYRLQPLTDIHLHSDLLKELGHNGNDVYVYMFVLVAVFILLVACVNFMNLSTAQSLRRTKEVGLRKVMGSNRKRLVGQFLTESVLYVGIAMFFAILLAEVLRAPFNTLTGKTLDIQFWVNPWGFVSLLLFIGLIGLIAGSYPAFFLSRFRPIEALSYAPIGNVKDKRLRTGLVTFQFFISTTLIICFLMIGKQIDFIQNKQLGFDKSRVLVIQNDREIGDTEDRQAFRAELTQKPGIENVAFSTGLPSIKEFHMRELKAEGANRGQGIQWYQADEHFAQSLGLEMKAGRWFSKSHNSDSTGLLLNEAAVQTLGLTDPVGKSVMLNPGANDQQQLQVLGVIENFHFESFQHAIKPLAIQHLHDDTFRDYITVKLGPGDVKEQITHIAQVWHKFEPDVPFNYSFLESRFDALFAAEQRLGKVFGLFTFLAVLIACLGLLGLTAFTLEKKAKEIGVRKVLGASIRDISQLLLKNFLKPVLLSIIISVPIAYFGLQTWLEHFAYKADLSAGVFVFGIIAIVLIAITTISFQTVKAARANPADILRDE